MTCDDDEITQSFKIKILVKKSEMKFLKSLCYNGNLWTFIATLYYANQFQSFLVLQDLLRLDQILHFLRVDK